MDFKRGSRIAVWPAMMNEQNHFVLSLYDPRACREIQSSRCKGNKKIAPCKRKLSGGE